MSRISIKSGFIFNTTEVVSCSFIAARNCIAPLNRLTTEIGDGVVSLESCTYFIAEVGSFTKAAEQLFVSQPFLSAGIKKLEQELDAILFERGGRRVLLTPAGRLFKEKAQSILAQYQSVRQDLEKLKDQPTLRLGTLHSIRSRNIAEIIGAFHSQHPKVTIEICNAFALSIQLL